MAHTRVAGRRGGLSVTVAPIGPTPATLSDPARFGRFALPAQLTQRLRWTLIFASFFAFAGGVISSRLRLGQPLMIAGVLGLLLQSEQFRWSTVAPPLLLWTAWSALGYFVSPYPDLVSDELIQLSKLCVITLVGVNALRTRAQLRAFNVFALFCFLIYPGRGALLNYITGANLVFGRAIWNGVYANPNDLASITLLLLSIAAGLVVSERARIWRLAALGVTTFSAFIIFITQSRGVLIALGMFVLAVLWRAPKRQRIRAVVSLAAVGAVIVAFAPASVWDRLSGLRGVTDTQNLGQVDSSAEQRFEIWKVARTIITEHPLAGVGLGAYKAEHATVAARPQFNPIARGGRDTHSTYLNVMAETGIPGFLLFAMIVIATVWYAERVRRKAMQWEPASAQQLLYLQLGLAAYLVAGIWGSYAKLNMFYLHLVLIWATAKALETEARVGAARSLPARR